MNLNISNDLCCPDCNSSLIQKEIKKDDLQYISGKLVCEHCSKNYQINNGVPCFVSSDQYVNSFSYEWGKHSKTQLEIDVEHTEYLFFKELGINKNELKNLKVLDAGVGPGRYAFIPINSGSEFHGVDLSTAVYQARKNYDSGTFIQADLQKLPYKKEYFDFIYSIGVLHHTPDPKQSFLSLIPYLKPGGSISIVLYNKGSLLYEYAKRWRKYTIKFDKKILYRLCWLSALLLYPIYKLPIFKLFIYYLPIDMHRKFEWRVLNTFDAYSPRYASTHHWSEIYNWFKEANLENITLQNTNSICIRGWKKDNL